jgi:YfiR/HmsC-like
MAPGNWNRRCGWGLLLGLVLACNAASQSGGEYQVKAAFLYNFAKFVEWPAPTFKTDTDPLRICILGMDPFGTALGDTVGGKTVSGRPFVVAGISEVNQAGVCQILFISASEKKRYRAIFADLRTSAILTVGETDGFANQGGMVNFKLENGRVRLEVNVEAAGLAKLRISSKVLKLAQIVDSGASR